MSRFFGLGSYELSESGVEKFRFSLFVLRAEGS